MLPLRSPFALTPLALFALLAAPPLVAQGGPPGTEGGEWRHYAGDHGSTKYSPLAQIDRDNFDRLEVAWRWQPPDDRLAEKTRFKPSHFRGTPLMVGGRVFVPTSLHQIAAIDAASGEALWTYDPQAYARGMITHGMWHHRGLEYWRDGESERLLIATGGRQLVSVDARTGKPDPRFGDGGIVDLEKDLGRDTGLRNISHTSPVIVVGDTVVVGSIIMDFPTRNANPPGHVRGYDVRTGKLKWRFHSIPQAGELGNETWENESWKVAGNTNVWSMMSADDELGYVYLPFGTATNDYYGGHRHGQNLFSESLVCLDADTGERIWHFQAVHHGLWDYDFPAAPNLIDVTVDGQRIKAVAQVSKQGFTYVFDRRTGEPVWPIEERPVPPSTVPGEAAWPTQPFPTKPPPFERQGFGEEQLIDFTPELRAAALETLKKYTVGPIFTPPTVFGEGGKLGTVVLPGSAGGANWSGASVDPETGLLYVPSHTLPVVMGLRQPDAARSDFRYTIAYGEIPGPEGLPIIKPPYRRITAVDLNRGELAWQIPFGDGPRHHPAIKHLDLGPLGTRFQAGVIAEGGILVTRTLLVTFLPDLDELGARIAEGSLLQAYDKGSGELLHSLPVDRTLHGSPMTYLHEGRQYLLITGGGREEPAELLAFALPAAGGPDTTARP